jgi:hypothetical protein
MVKPVELIIIIMDLYDPYIETYKVERERERERETERQREREEHRDRRILSKELISIINTYSTQCTNGMYKNDPR